MKCKSLLLMAVLLAQTATVWAMDAYEDRYYIKSPATRSTRILIRQNLEEAAIKPTNITGNKDTFIESNENITIAAPHIYLSNCTISAEKIDLISGSIVRDGNVALDSNSLIFN